jgi:predicted lipid carrier protein YhbT
MLSALKTNAPLRVPEFEIPRPIAGIAARLPQQPPTLALVLALNAALGRILPRDALEPLLDRQMRIRVTDAGLDLRFILTPQGFRSAPGHGAPDLTITARACDFLALALRQEDPDTLFFNRRLLMEGDTELGLLVKNTLDSIDLPRLTPADLAPRRVLTAVGRRLFWR